MATPKRRLILDNLCDALRSINGAPGNKIAVRKVERTVKEWATVGGADMPWIGFKAGRERHVHRPFGLVEVRLPIDIVGHVNAADDVERSDLLNDLMDDIVGEIQIDTRRGGNAIHTTVLESETDEGDPDTQDSRGGSGSLVVRIEVFYERTTSFS